MRNRHGVFRKTCCAAGLFLAATAAVLFTSASSSGQDTSTRAQFTVNYPAAQHINHWANDVQKRCPSHRETTCSQHNSQNPGIWKGHQDQYEITWLTCPSGLPPEQKRMGELWWPAKPVGHQADRRPDLHLSGTNPALKPATHAQIAGRIPDDQWATCTKPTLTVTDASASEGEQVTFKISSSGHAAQAFVWLSTGDGTATSPADFNSVTNHKFYLTPGVEREYYVSAKTDGIVEGNETFTLNVVGGGQLDGVTASATGTILNVTTTTPPPNTPSLSVTGGSASEGGQVTFTIISAGHTAGAYVGLSTADGTATSPADFNAVNNTRLYLSPGGQTRTYSVAAKTDSVQEQDETFTFNVAGETSGPLAGVSASATGTIQDATSPPTGLTVTDASATEGEDVVFTITLSGTSGTVRWEPKSGTAPGGATINRDFTWTAEDSTGASRWLADGGSLQVSVKTVVDEYPEVAETFTLKAWGPDSLTAEGTGTIRDAAATDPDDDDEEDLSPTTGGWSVTGVCRDGITVLQGRSVEEILPSYFPPLAQGERLTDLGGYVRPDPDKHNGRRNRAGKGLPFSLNTELEEVPGDVWNNQLQLKGTIRYSANPQQRRYNTNPGVYTFDVYSTYRKTMNPRSGREMYPGGCSVTVIRRPSNPVCPDNRVWKRDEYVNISGSSDFRGE